MPVTLTVDGQEVTVPDGATILDACRQAGIYIPTLCFDTFLKPYGACRMCVVEVERAPKPLSSCNTAAMDGMVVSTKTEPVVHAQQGIMEMTLQHHPLDCPYCDKSGVCDLQHTAYEVGVYRSKLGSDNPNEPDHEFSPLIEWDPNRCIYCGKCVRVCDERVGDSALTFNLRGFHSYIGTQFDEPLDCVECGECIEVCPVGALLSRPFMHSGRAWQVHQSESVCNHCSVGCQMHVETRMGEVLRTKANPALRDQTPVNTRDRGPGDGMLCTRGRFGYDYIHDDGRVTQPLVRKDGQLEPASWDEALSLVAARIAAAKAEDGPDSVAAITSGRLSDEENYLIARLMREVVATNNIDSTERWTLIPTLHALGPAAFDFTISQMEQMDAFLVVGGDLMESHDVLGMRMRQWVRDEGKLLIQAGSLPSRQDDRFARRVLRVRPGAEQHLLQGLAAELARQSADGNAPADLRGYSLERAAADTGIDAAAIGEAAAQLAEAGNVGIVWGLGSWLIGGAEALAQAAANLTLALPQARLYPLANKANSRGLAQMGAGADVLPNFRSVDDAQARSALGRLWDVVLPDAPGHTLDALLGGADVSVLYVIGEDLATSARNRHQTQGLLERAGFVVVQDLFVNATAAEYADVVLPAVSFAEKTGTYTNLEGRAQRAQAAIPPVGEAKPDWQIFTELALQLGARWAYRNSDSVVQEIAAVLAEIPVTHSAPRFAWQEPPALPSVNGDGKLLLVTQDHLFVPGVTGRYSGNLRRLVEAPTAEIHPAQLARLGIEDGESVGIQANGADLTVTAKANDKLTEDVVYLPGGFPDAPVGALLGAEATVAVSVRAAAAEPAAEASSATEGAES